MLLCDLGGQYLSIFSATGEYKTRWDTGPSQLWNPQGIAVAPTGDVYISNTANDRIQWFSPRGEFLGTWGYRDSIDGATYWPAGLAVAPSGRIYMADLGNFRVQYFEGVPTAPPVRLKQKVQPDDAGESWEKRPDHSCVKRSFER